MGDKKEVRAVATKGRAETDEFTTEYIIQYSDDGEGWRSFSNSDGAIQVL